MGGDRLQESNHRRSLPRRGSRTSTLWKVIYCMQCLSQDIQLFRERLSGKMCTRQPRKVIWDMIDTLFLTTVAVEPTFVDFHQHSRNICPWSLRSFFQISLEKSADKTTHNTFRDCRVHFLRQPFLKQLYIIPCCLFSSSYILSNIMHSAKVEIRECDKWSLIRG